VNGETIIESSGGGSAYTGAAGNADGGSVYVSPSTSSPHHHLSLIRRQLLTLSLPFSFSIATPSYPWSRPSANGLLSSGDLLSTGGKNGGDGGYAKSGDALGGNAGNALVRPAY
jgi:hypothetical protein